MIVTALLVGLLYSLWDGLESEVDVAKVRKKMRKGGERWLMSLVDGNMADDGGWERRGDAHADRQAVVTRSFHSSGHSCERRPKEHARRVLWQTQIQLM